MKFDIEDYQNYLMFERRRAKNTTKSIARKLTAFKNFYKY